MTASHHGRALALLLSICTAACVASVGGSDEQLPPAGEPGAGSGSGTGFGSGSGTDPTSTAAGAGWKVLAHDYQVQQTGYWCGPAASRVALSARIAPPSQQTLANQLGTTVNGTDWIGQVTRVLNQDLGAARYVTVELPADPPSQAQRDQLWRDVVLGIDSGHPIVANIVAPPGNQPPGYPGNQTIYHYFAVVGYNPATYEVYIADSANFSGNQHYWLTLGKLASLIPPKGYATYRCGSSMTVGVIDEKYRALGGCGSFLGAALTEETATPDGVGRYNVFQGGSVYWSAATGAFEVHGAIRDTWAAVGWEAGALGYPLSDETPTPDGVGRYSVFEHGSIYWTPATGAHEVHGVIRDRWAELGWEAGALGYPTSDEYAVQGGRKNDFQHGSITFDASTGVATAVVN